MEKLILFLMMFLSLKKNIVKTVTPKPTIDMEKVYGPCTKVTVLMYHHIQPDGIANKLKQTGLSVSPEFFKTGMEYLISKGYKMITPNDIINFFDKQIPIPAKPVLITLDDAYEDNFIYAYPILKELGIKATIFTPTGLVTVPDYLTWNEIEEMKNSGLLYFGNHTWSHRSSSATIDILDKEIRLADGQLQEKGLNTDKVFAYPYGTPSSGAETTLTKYGYKLAFTTYHGNLMCKGKRFELPRIRVGNTELSKLGL